MEFQFIFMAIIFAFVLGITFWTWWNNPRTVTKRRLKGTPRTNVADVREGKPVKITGTVRYAGTPLSAPLSSRRCAYFEATVKQNQGKNNWKTVAEEKAGAQFFLVDDSGRALITLADLSTAVVQDVKFNSGVLNDPTPQAYAFLEANGVDSTGFLGFNKTLAYTEGVIEEGERVAVYGLGKWEADPEPGKAGDGYRDKPMRLRMIAPHDGPMLVSDDPEVTAS